MTIRDASQTNVGAHVSTRYFSDVDGDLSGFASRYGTSQRELVEYADAHWPGATQSNEPETRARIGRGEAFALRIPSDESRFAWGSFENDTGRDLTLAEVIRQINSHPWPHEEPHASAYQLFSYAVNADFRSGALHGRSSSDQRRFETDPGSVPVARGAVIRFPLVGSPMGNNVSVAHGCGSTFAPRATWIAAFEAELRTVEHLAARLGRFRDIISNLQGHAVMQVARLDFVIEYLERVVQNSGGASHNPTAASAHRRIVELRRVANQFLVTPGPNAHRPGWIEAHRHTARDLAAAMQRPRLRDWTTRVFLHWQEIGLDARYIGAVSAQWAQIIEEFGLTEVSEARALWRGVTTAIQDEEPAPEAQSVITVFVKNWGALVQAAVGDTPGPLSLMGAIMKSHVLQVVMANQPSTFAGVSEGWRRKLMLIRLNESQQQALRLAMQDTNTLQRAPRMRAVYAAAIGRTASALAGAIAIYSFYLSWNEEESRRDWVGRASRAVSLTGGLLSSVSGATAVGQGAANLYELGIRESLDNFAESFGKGLTKILGVIGFIQGALQAYDGYTHHDRQALMVGMLTALGNLATVAGAMLAIPGLEAAGAVLGVVCALLPLIQSMSGSPVVELLLEALRLFAEDHVPVGPAERAHLDTARFAGRSLYNYVVEVESVPQLRTAYTTARETLQAWGGERLDRTPENERWLRHNGFGEVIAQLTQSEILRHPDREPLPGGVRTDASVDN